MQMIFYINNINNIPSVLDETDDFAVVYKPSRMHSAPLPKGGGDTLLDWYMGRCPQAGDLSGRGDGRGGLLHRLDFETQGLMLFAKNQKSFDFLLTQQDEGNFIKEYSAICQKSTVAPVSFPPPPFAFPPSAGSVSDLFIESFFRPFGPGRKQVRPVTEYSGKGRKETARNEIAKDHSGYYRTNIVNVINNVNDINKITDNKYYTFSLRIKRGFRHQIRCHLAWIGCPVVNDPLYGEQPANGFLALRSHALFFTDPASRMPREYRIEALSKSVL